ncbi:MAG: sulfite exporter TauE/SafE family protein, partial [Pseudomonadota bacterium]
IIGSLILLKTPEQTFSGLIPYLLLFATILFICGGKINQFLRNKHSFQLGNFAAWCLQLCIAIYGGYFGAGAGIVMLAMLALTGMDDIHEMNAIKTILGVSINAVAVTIFILAGIIAWQPALTMMGGAIAGGYFGAIYAKKLPQKVVRGFVIFSASAMTIYFFIR